jgi:hypothetical protein
LKYNETELDIIFNLLTLRTELASERLSAASEKVMVITFYAAQARRLQDHLQQASRPDVLVMTVDSAQGSETDYVILSCVRCNGGHDIGRFVADDRRVNVAMSRARKQLIVVGSSKTLVRRQQTFSQDLWSSFKEYTDALQIPLPLAPRTFCGGIDTPRWDVKDGGWEVDLRLFPERRSFTDDEMEELARQVCSPARPYRPLSLYAHPLQEAADPLLLACSPAPCLLAAWHPLPEQSLEAAPYLPSPWRAIACLMHRARGLGVGEA